MTDFYCVISNRDILKIRKGTPEETKVKIWEFMDPSPTHFLTSLAYVSSGEPMPSAQKRFFDCGAWSYKMETNPTFTPEQCVTSYEKIAYPGDLIAAPDHMVLLNHDAKEEERRIKITLENARIFLDLTKDSVFIPIAVVHGNSIPLRLEMLNKLLDMGYRHIALGGLAGRAGSRRRWIRELVEKVSLLKQEEPFYVHALGVSALSWVRQWLELDVDSYDGSSMFFEAFTASKFYVFDSSHPNLIQKISVKDADPESIEPCNCHACKRMREQGIDTRRMGSNENNMGRAVHNVNIYQKAFSFLNHESIKKNTMTKQLNLLIEDHLPLPH